MPRDVEMTRGQARQRVADHQARHGREQELTEEAEKQGFGKHDVPSQEDLDTPPGWFKNGKGKRPAHPDD